MERNIAAKIISYSHKSNHMDRELWDEKTLITRWIIMEFPARKEHLNLYKFMPPPKPPKFYNTQYWKLKQSNL